jgi:hypothetical protein
VYLNSFFAVNIVKELAKIVALPKILKLPLFVGPPCLWQMFVYSIFSGKNKLRDVCRLPIEGSIEKVDKIKILKGKKLKETTMVSNFKNISNRNNI